MSASSPGVARSYPQIMEGIKSSQEDLPFEFSGKAGDYLIWHHRLCHAAGQNFSPNIRMSVLCE